MVTGYPVGRLISRHRHQLQRPRASERAQDHGVPIPSKPPSGGSLAWSAWQRHPPSGNTRLPSAEAVGSRVPRPPGPDLLQRGAQPGAPVGARRLLRGTQCHDTSLEPVGTAVTGDELGDRPRRKYLAVRQHDDRPRRAAPRISGGKGLDRATTCDTTRYGTAEALAWDRMHPRLQARGPGSTTVVNSP